MSEKRTRIGATVVKTLFAMSGNQCYRPGCEELMTRQGWDRVNGEIAHICGERKDAARYVATLSVKERNSFENLMLLCPKHHKLVDYLEPDAHPADLLRQWKEQHEQRAAQAWATDVELSRYALLLLQPVYVTVEVEPEVVRIFAEDTAGGTDSATVHRAEAGVATATTEAHDPSVVTVRRYSLTLFPYQDDRADGVEVSSLHFDDLAEAQAEADKYPDRAWEIRDHHDGNKIVGAKN